MADLNSERRRRHAHGVGLLLVGIGLGGLIAWEFPPEVIGPILVVLGGLLALMSSGYDV